MSSCQRQKGHNLVDCQSIFENAGTAMCILEVDGTISEANSRFISMTGYCREEVVQRKRWMEFVHPEDLPQMMERHNLRREQPEQVPRRYEFRFMDKGKMVRTIDLYVDMIPGTDRSVASLVDITHHKQTERSLRKTNQRLTTLHHAALEMAVLRKEQDVYSLLVDATVNILGHALCTLGLVEGDMLVVKAATEPRNVSVPAGRGIAGRTLECGKTIVVHDMQEQADLARDPASYRSLISIPVGKIGVFQIVSEAAFAFSDADVKLVELVTNYAYTAIRRIRYERHIEFMSSHDALTGLCNRDWLEQQMQRLEKRVPLGVIMVDLNGLKLINDTYGYGRGDAFLKQVTSVLRQSVRPEDLVARWGGDEFAIVLPDADEKKTVAIGRRVVNACNNMHVETLPVSVAVGVATRGTVAKSLSDTIKEAEDSMYRNKLTSRQSTRNSVVMALLHALATKSFETEMHTRRMQEFAQQIGKKLFLSETELHRLRLLITLHDIGKINIPEEILNKPGPLTDEEWQIRKQHSEIGCRIAESTQEFSHVAKEILAHHERWDGSGYPQQLVGEEIPLLARIAAIVDAYEVMSNGRPYKRPMQPDEIATELKQCAGSQFDPTLVLVALELLQ